MKTKSFFAIKLLNVFFILKPIKHNLIILFLLFDNYYSKITIKMFKIFLYLIFSTFYLVEIISDET